VWCSSCNEKAIVKKVIQRRKKDEERKKTEWPFMSEDLVPRNTKAETLAFFSFVFCHKARGFFSYAFLSCIVLLTLLVLLRILSNP
jgi:hypothetical protein